MPEELISVQNLKKWFPVKLGFIKSIMSRQALYVKAVNDISFKIYKGEIFGLAGESGSGKTTTGRLMLRLIEATDGKILFKGKDITKIDESEMRPLRKKMQIIFQDPYESLNPKMTIGDIVAEPLRVLGGVGEKEIAEKVAQSLENMKLTPPDEFLLRYPHELSGGQRQRVASARALVLNPDFIVADEPVSMLDVSVRAEVLNLMLEVCKKLGVAFLYITHDLALSRHICDKIAVLYLGKVMEMGTTDQVIAESLHPYTRALIAAVPVPDPSARRVESVIKGEIPSPINPPSGCVFHTRCQSYIGDICRNTVPELADQGDGHLVACHLFSKATKK